MDGTDGAIDVDVLIVGAGPAGASTAVFLARFGLKVLMISRHRGTANTPRAHITSQRTLEALRDAGLEQQCLEAGTPGSFIANWFWLRSMAGEELARAWAWGNDPARHSDYRTASPCEIIDLPQSRMEPILIGEATRLGAHVRFGWELQDFDQDEDSVTARISDRLGGSSFTVKARYMVGADGGRSRVVEQLGLPLAGRHGLASVYNIECEADLSPYMEHRPASLYNVVQPKASAWGATATWRMVRPWDQWLVGVVLPPHLSDYTPTDQEFVQRIRDTAGVPDLEVKIRSTSKWQINDVTAEYYSVGRVHCMGDAVHRHPPANALGSNTCIQDGFNLAWKLAYVLTGKAHPRLLDSFNAERQPVGAQIVARANKSMFEAIKLMGMFGGGGKDMLSDEELAELSETPEGRARMRAELSGIDYNGHAHGVEMTRFYRSDAVVHESDPPAPERDPELYYHPSSLPGSVLPHCWLVTREPGPLVSTLDIAGKGRFMLFSGHGGETWRDATASISEKLDVEIAATLVGNFLDYEDPYQEWLGQRGVEESGCVLVRPDHIVAWRANELPADPAAALENAMSQILGWKEPAAAEPELEAVG